MNCSQNSTPAAKKVPCISQMCTAWWFAARSNSTGRCQATITALNSTHRHPGPEQEPAHRPQRA